MAQRRLQILPYTVARWAIIGKTSVRWPKQREMLAQPLHSEPAIAEIVHQVQQSGAGEGWSALWGKIHVPGLGLAFGTKLLYFAGYKNCVNGLRPLVLDANVRRPLNGAEAGLTAKIKNHRADYERYLHLAEAWYNEHSRNGSPEIVEFALFKPGKELAKAE